NMEMEPDIENMTMSEYLEYEAVKERRLWDDVRSRRSPTHYDEADFSSSHRNKSNTFYYPYSHDIPPPPVQSYPKNYLVSTEDSICKQDVDLEEDREEDGNDRDTFDMWDIMVEDVERIRNFFNIPDEIDEIVQPLDDYVAPATKSILDKLLEEFRDEILNVTMDDEEADFNPTKDLEELERLLAEEPQSNFTKIQVHSVIINTEPFLHTQLMNPLYGVFKTSKPCKVDRDILSPGSAISVNGVFEIDMNDNVSKYNNNSIFSINKKRKLDLNSSYLWHCRLAHIGKTRMQKLQREGLLESINDESYDKCESCISGKMTKKPFNNNIERATDLLGLIHTDVCGPLRHVSRKGASYFLTFTDDFSRYGYVYLLKHKHEVFETFKVFKSEVELQLGKKIKALRSDRGGEYLSQEFKEYLGKNGIVQHLTSPYTPQQNGVSERRNRTLLDMVRSMFNLTTLPLSFWDYALESAVRILNMVPTKKVDKTPYEIWHGKAPNLSYLKVWGCEAYVKRDSADKLQQRSVKCIFVGYPKETMGYYFYFPPENKVIVARYGDFLERDLISQEFSGRDYDLEDDHMDTLPSENTSEIPVEPESLGPPPELIPVRRSERPKNAPNRLCLNMEVEDDEVGDLGEPANYRAAMIDPDKVLWQGAMDEEMKSMKVNKVWIVVDRPPNAKVVRSKWLYKKKTDMDGKVHTYKARLVAKGCTQTYGIDYEETFSPVADIRAIRILIAIAAYYDYEIWQMDVKTAFLNGRLDEDIYMEQPEGYVDPKFPNGVCKLQRAIYGLKQASRQWNKRFDEEIKRFGFIQNRDEPCVYRKASGSDVVFLILYVDDILIMGNNIPKLKEVKDYLGKCFSVKDLGEAAYILGIKIYRDRSLRLIGLNQSAYIDKILKKFNMQNSKKGFIPMEVKHDLSNEMCASSDEEKAYMKRVPYASAVGSIMYAVRCTRPDVAFAQNLVSRYQQNPGKLHWVAVKHILKYLRNTKDMFLVYGGNPDTELDVTGFCDASWQCDKDDTKSQTGYVFVVNGGAVDWKSKKQTTIAMHATQSEYMAASEAAMEAVWIRKFVEDLGVMPSISKPINMYCDNSAAIIFANEPGVMKGARHFLRRYHYVREQVESGEIKLIKVHTDKNLADAFTKALPRGKVSEHANGIGLRLASSFMHIWAEGTTEGRKQNINKSKSWKIGEIKDKVVKIAAGDSDDALVCCIENTIEDRIMDSGASFHATCCKEELERCKEGRVEEKGNGLIMFGVANENGLEILEGGWALQESGDFTVRGLTKLVEEKILNMESGGEATTWNNWVPKKVNVFVWRALKGRLPVREELDKRGIDLNTVLCPSCGDTVESCSHCLVMCNFAMSVWEKNYSWWKIGIVNAFSIGKFFCYNGNANVPSHSSKMWQAVIWTSGYFIWKERNARVFKGKASSLNKILQDIQLKSYEWIARRSGKKSAINWQQWLFDSGKCRV
ncbi:putative RNA-directed DNA polymerase, partial [Tanacetum coccineum]